MTISVCMATIRPNTLEHAIRSIEQQTFSDWELVVVGQGDEALLRETTMRAAAGDLRVRYLHLNRRGLSAARNMGIRASSGEIIAFIDDDCEAKEDWLEVLHDSFAPEIGFVGGTVLAPSRAGSFISVCPSLEPLDVVYVPHNGPPPDGFGVLGANMAVRRRDAIRVGSFDECLGAGAFFAGGEEHDYVLRLEQLGVGMRSNPKAVVNHTYGYRYGLRATHSHKKDRIRGDGALAGKRTLVEKGDEHVVVPESVRAMAISHVRAMKWTRLPISSLRAYYFLTSYAQVLRGYGLNEEASNDPSTAVLRPLAEKRPLKIRHILRASRATSLG